MPGGDPVALGRQVVARCLAAGFAAAGVCAAEPSGRAREFRRWLAEGRHGEMRWLADDAETRLDVRRELPGARSVVMVADQYEPRGGRAEVAEGQGRLARYARGLDYHRVLKRRLHALADRLRVEHPGHEFRSFVDSAPVMEREHAARAGLGWIGKHTLLIHPRLGSWVLLGGMVTTLALRADPDAAEGDGGPVSDHCGTCTRCIDACPTGAIGPYTVDASRCISYLTIEHRAPIGPGLHGPMGAWVFGCDVCQEVCPHNTARRGEPTAANPAHAPLRTGLDLLAVLGWTRHDRSATLGPTALKRATLAMFKRNALIAAGNALAQGRAGGGALRAKIEDLAWSAREDALVRETARAVLARLSAPGPSAARATAPVGPGPGSPARARPTRRRAT